MFDYIKGVLITSSPERVVIDTGGIGYCLRIPATHFAHLTDFGKEVKIYTSLIVREDSQTLYGFLTEAERDLFETLSTITGIGPKTALALIGHMTTEELERAVLNSDTRRLSQTPGIGKKTAERLILEMRDKLKKRGITPSKPGHAKMQSPLISDTMAALVNLGYLPGSAQSAAEKALKEKGDEASLSELITCALKLI